MTRSIDEKRRREYRPSRDDPSASAAAVGGGVMRGECTRTRREHFKSPRYFTLGGLGVKVQGKTLDCGSMPLTADGELDTRRISAELRRTDAHAPGLYIAALR